MPKINFSVPYLNSAGAPIMRPKTDESKLKTDEQGSISATLVKDENGELVQEQVLVRDMLVSILQRGYVGDDKLPFEERSKRGKLARKIQNNNSASYNDNEIKVIEEFSAKAGTTMLLAQLDDMIHGPEKSEDAA